MIDREKVLKGLKPCPFCGGRAHLEQMGWPHHVFCTHCGAKTTSALYAEDGEQAAIAKWNRRAPDVIRCRDCKFFEVRDWWCEMNGVPLLAASDAPSCMRWGDGCMTNEDGYCFLAERKEPDNDQP